MRGWLRYFCMYCFSRMIFNAARAGLRNHNHVAPAAPCKHHGTGVLLGIVSLPFIGVAVLIAIGFLTK